MNGNLLDVDVARFPLLGTEAHCNNVINMTEIMHESMLWVNMPYTALLGLVLLYWLLVILGALDINLGDFDLFSDIESDVDAEVVMEAGWLMGVLQFLNLGQVPTMIVASFLIVSLWTGSMILNHYWNVPATWISFFLFIPNFVLAGVVTHFCARPFARLFRELNHQGVEKLPMTGRIGKVITSEVNDHFGQVEIETGGAPLVISARAVDGETYTKGDSVVVVEALDSESSYRVKFLGIQE